jgi:FhaA, N-terminal domain/FHA domain
MNLLKSVESTIANLVEGAFGRIFRSEVRPVELARKLEREMDAHRTVSLSRVYAPHEYAVWLSPSDRARYEGIEEDVIDELCAYLLEHARREDLILRAQPTVAFYTDARLALGEFGIKAQPPAAVDPAEEGARRAGRERAAPVAAHHAPSPPAAAPAAAAEEADEHGQTMIYSRSARLRGPLEEAHAQRTRSAALTLSDGRRVAIPHGGATIGRSRECDVVLEDAGISRLHAELRPVADGWSLRDLGSTNGVVVNGRRIRDGVLVREGDRIELGSTEVSFELR